MKKLSLDQIKKIELDMLLSFHTFCEENKLQYSLCGGTLLGAIRHKGFIPWDDDIDVFMPRPDYEKLRSLWSGKSNVQNYILFDYLMQNKESDKKNMFFPFLKIVDRNTKVMSKDSDCEKYYLGVWIDVFPIDGLPSSKIKTVILYKRIYFYRHLVAAFYKNRITERNIIKKIAKQLFFIFSKMLGIERICKKLDTISQSYSYEFSESVGGVINGYGPQERLHHEDLTASSVTFEGYEFYGISGYDKYLSNLYGNYMELPPETKRITHDILAWKKE